MSETPTNETKPSLPPSLAKLFAECRAADPEPVTDWNKRAHQKRMARLAALERECERVMAQSFNKERFEQAPCYLCGYNGPGYFNPSTHKCAERFHASKSAALRGEDASATPSPEKPPHE